MSIPEALSTSTPTAGGDDIQQRIEARISGGGTSSGESVKPDDSQNSSPGDGNQEEPEAEKGEDKPPEGETKTTDSDNDSGLELEAADFAQLLGIEEGNLIVDEEGKVYLRTKVDGEIGKVSVNDLIKSYQTDAHVTRRSQAIAEERRAFETQAQQKAEEIKTYLTTAAALVQMQEAALTQEFQVVDWNYLHANDPGRWAALKQEYSDRVAQIQQIKSQGVGIYNSQVQQYQHQIEAVREQSLEMEADRIREKFPAWNDPEVAKAQFSQMVGVACSVYGFTQSEAESVADHRMLLMMQDAMKYRQGLKQGAETVKKVVNLPKVQRPGQARGESAVQKTATEQKRLRLKSSGSTRDLAALLEDRI